MGEKTDSNCIKEHLFRANPEWSTVETTDHSSGLHLRIVRGVPEGNRRPDSEPRGMGRSPLSRGYVVAYLWYICEIFVVYSVILWYI